MPRIRKRTSARLDHDVRRYLSEATGKTGEDPAARARNDLSDRSRERRGDYLRVAFLPYATLEIEWARGVRVSPEMRRLITEDAARLAARRGEVYATSGSGNHVRLGG